MFQFVPIASEHLLEEPGSIFSAASFQIFTTYIDEFTPELSFLLADQFWLSQESCFSPLTIMVALCWTLPSIPSLSCIDGV